MSFVNLTSYGSNKTAHLYRSLRGSRERGQGVRTPPVKSQNIGFISNNGLDPLKITKLLSQHLMLGHHWHASKMPFKWHFAGGPMMARL